MITKSGNNYVKATRAYDAYYSIGVIVTVLIFSILTLVVYNFRFTNNPDVILLGAGAAGTFLLFLTAILASTIKERLLILLSLVPFAIFNLVIAFWKNV